MLPTAAGRTAHLSIRHALGNDHDPNGQTGDDIARQPADVCVCVCGQGHDAATALGMGCLLYRVIHPTIGKRLSTYLRTLMRGSQYAKQEHEANNKTFKRTLRLGSAGTAIQSFMVTTGVGWSGRPMMRFPRRFALSRVEAMAGEGKGEGATDG